MKFKIKRLLDNKIWGRRLVLMLLDMSIITLSGCMALLTRFEFVSSDIPEEYLDSYLAQLPAHLFSAIVIFWLFHLYHSLWRYASLKEALNICMSCAIVEIVEIGIILLQRDSMPRSFYLLSFMYSVFGIVGMRFLYRYLRMLKRENKGDYDVKNVMVIGAGDMGTVIIKEMSMSEYLNCNVKCIIDDDPQKKGCYIHGVNVVGGRELIKKYVKKFDIDQIVIAMPSQSKKTIREILEICKETECELKILPGMYQIVNDEVQVKNLRDVDINDLLGRDAVVINDASIVEYISGKTIMVTGGGGSIGSELCRQIAQRGPEKLIIYDIYENNAYDIQQELKITYPNIKLKVLIGSICDKKRVDEIMKKYKPDIIYHAAAHKHVPLMEDSPNEAIKNNVVGTFVVADAAHRWNVKKFVMISTDKAVNPTNIMGASKRLCEMIVQMYSRKSDTEFVAVRFGNVLGSNGSVIPLFRKQLSMGGPITVTHPDIIRYFMTIPEAVSLVLQAGVYAKGGEIFVLDMGEPVKILDLAKNLIRLSGFKVGEDIEIKFTGLRPGEKLYEELLMDEEGLTETDNKLIHIGRPIVFDEVEFMKEFEELQQMAMDETKDIRDMVKKMVPTYQPKES